MALMIFWLKTTRLPEIQKTQLPIQIGPAGCAGLAGSVLS
jgi:hypothetical protein